MFINNLPDEILHEIFLNLPIEERIFYASNVCKRWKYLMPFEDFNEICIETFHDRVCRSGTWCSLKIAGKDKQQIKSWLKHFMQCVLPVYGYYVKTIDFNFIKHNAIYRMLIDEEILQIVCENCPSIVGLNLLNCDLSLKSVFELTKFRSLKHLSVIDDWKFDIANVWKYLQLTHFDSHMSRPFDNVTRPEDLLSIKTDIGSNFFLNLHIFCSRYSNVQELVIKNCRWVSPENFSLISRLNKLKVLNLELQDDLLHSDEIGDICHGCRSIEQLSISYLQPNTGDNINLTPLKLLTNLKSLCFNVQYIYGEQLAIIANLKSLIHLELCCTKFRSLENFDERSSDVWPNLERVSIFCNDDSQSGFNNVGVENECSSLYRLFLQNSKTLKTAGVVTSSFNQAASIEAKILSEYYFQKTSQTTLNFLTDVQVWFEDSKCLSEFFQKNHFDKLKTLNLNGFAWMSQQTAHDIAVSCPNLERLTICKTIEVKVEIVVALLNVCKKLKHIKTSAKLIHLPSEELMFVIGSHPKLNKFEYFNLLPAYHLSHFKNVIFGRKELLNAGHQLHPIYIEANGTFYLPQDVLNDLKSLLVCFTNVYLIETKFRCSQ